MKNSLLATAAISALSACGGDAVNNFDPTVNNFDAFAEKFDTYNNYFQEIDQDKLPATANMKGFFTGYQESYENLFVGTARATADFNAGSLNGSVSNFDEYEYNGGDGCSENLKNCSVTLIQDLVGSLTISGTIDSVKFDFNTTGTLSGFDDAGSPLDADVTLDGNSRFRTVNDNLVAVSNSKGTVELSSNGKIVFDGSIFGILYLEE